MKRNRARRRWIWRGWLAAIPSLVCLSSRADGQVFQGAVLEDSTRRPVVKYPVVLTRLLPTVAAVVSWTATDPQGLFQLSTNKPGIYRLEFGDSLTGLTYGPIDTVHADTVVLRQYVVSPRPDVPRAVLLNYHVHEPVVQAPGQGSAIRYPELLRQQGICGEVLAKFVVDPSGAADMSTFRVLRSTDSLFSHAVREGVKRTRFIAAIEHGRAARSEVTQPFTFTVLSGPPLLFPGTHNMLPKDPFATVAETSTEEHPSCFGHVR